MIKIIYLISHPPAYKMYINEPRPEINWNTPNGSWVGIWGYDWGNQIGNAVLHETNEFEFEVWQPDLRADKIYHHKFDNGLVHKLYPAYYKKKNRRNILTSEKILYEIEAEGNNNKIILQTSIQKTKINEEIINKMFSRIPIIFQSLGNLSFLQFSFSKNPIKLPGKIINYLDNIFFIKKQKYLFISNYLPDEKINYLKKIENSESIIYYNLIGLSNKYFNVKEGKKIYRKELGINDDEFVILSSSRLNNLKQIDKLIEALNNVSVNNMKLIITGTGDNEYIKYLNSLIEHSNKDIELKGFLDEDELIKYYIASDLFVDASLNDGGPMSAWKALATGTPVVTTATGNVGGFLRRNNAGYTIPKRIYKHWIRLFEDIIKGIIKVKSVDTNLVKQTVSWKACAKQYINNYKKVLEDFYGK